jgi:hypothetical protein
MSWLEPEAAAAFTKMNEACGQRIEYTDLYRSTLTQILAIKNANPEKKRLYAPPTKSGHNFGFSCDVAIKETLENFQKSKVTELVIASRDRQALGRWMKDFGWTGITTENWHFNFLGTHESAVKKIDTLYDLTLTNEDVQRALNALLGKKIKPLAIDGQLGPKSHEAALLAVKVLGYADEGGFTPWFRRLLSGATVTIEEVPWATST